MTVRNLLFVTVLTAAFGLARASSAALVDTMDSTSNFTGAFGSETATANGDGTVTLTRTVANVDAGINWGKSGSRLSLVDEGLLTITPSQPVNGGYFNVNLLLFNSAGTYLAEPHWLTDNNSTAVRTLDVASFVSGLSQSNPALAAATQYVVRFRVNPWGKAGAGFTFTEISALPVPEPATGMLLLAGLPLLWALRRGTQKG